MSRASAPPVFTAVGQSRANAWIDCSCLWCGGGVSPRLRHRAPPSPPHAGASPLFVFDHWHFDPASGELRRGESTARLRPQPALLLTLLLERAGDVVTREEIIARVWPDAMVEFDQSVNYAVRAIRAALGESAGETRYIETLPRRGYRFRAAVQRIDSDAPPPAVSSRRRRLAWAGMLAAAMLLLGIFAGARLWPASGNGETGSAVRVAVMVLRHAEGNAVSERTALALSERLTAALTGSGGPSLSVIGPTTTARYGSERNVIATLATELNVAYVLGGSVNPERADAVFLELIRMDDRSHVWAAATSLADTNLATRAADTLAVLLGAMVSDRADERGR